MTKPKRGPDPKPDADKALRFRIYPAKKHVEAVGGILNAQRIAKQAIENAADTNPQNKD